MVFSVSVTNLINLLFIAAGIGVCGLCFLSISFAKHLRKEVRRYFQVFFLMILFYIHAHLARQLMDGIPGEGVRTALYVITFLETLSAGLMTHMMSLLILAAANAEKKAKTYVIVLYALLAAHTAVLVAGCFTGAIYYFDAANTYHRGALYLLSNISPMLMMAVDVVLIVRYRKNIDNLLKSAFWLFIVAPVVAIVFQLLFFGIQFIIFATVAAAVYMFGVIIKLQ
ncbi:MAG: hypothetical protein J6X34_01755, partial [Clostridia bacterium]|nr:hypothetical protein [Clostridia bacterium]